MSDKKEILERVLLLMKYDNKTTLTENLEFLLEQYGQMYPSLATEPNVSDNFFKQLENEGPITPYKTITIGNEKYEVPQSAVGIAPNNSESFIKGLKYDGIDDKGRYNYVKTIRQRIGNNRIFSNVDENTKLYYPDPSWEDGQGLTDFIGFKIPKGTKVLREEKTGWFDFNLDEHFLSELPEDVDFVKLFELPVENRDMSINPKENSRGWVVKKSVFTQDKQDPSKWTSYNPQTFIDKRTPSKVFWDDFGLHIEMVVQIVLDVASIACGPYVVMCAYAANAVFNLTVGAVQWKIWDDPKATAFNVFFAMLPLIHGKIYSPVLDEVVKKFGKDKFTKLCQELSELIIQKSPKTGSEWGELYQSLKPELKEILASVSQLKTSEIKSMYESIVKLASQEIQKNGIKIETVRGLFSTLLSGSIKNLPKATLVSGKRLAKFASTLAMDITLIHQLGDVLTKIKGSELTPIEEYTVYIFLSEIPEESREIVAKSIIDGYNSDKNSEEYKNAVKITQDLINRQSELVQQKINSTPKEELIAIFGDDFVDYLVGSDTTKVKQ